MPKERRDLISNIIATKTNWTNKEAAVWLDNEGKAEFNTKGQKHIENRHREILARITQEHTRDTK
jgi:hypothetical protein